MPLERLLEEVAPLHTTLFTPARSRMPPLYYADDNPRPVTGQFAVEIMGKFYEHLAAYLFGGSLENSFRVDQFETPVDIIHPITGKEDREIIRPDLVTTDHIFEVKGIRYNHVNYLIDSQIEAYRSMQVNFPDHSFSYTFFRHAVPGIRTQRRKNVQRLRKELAANTLYNVVVPLQVILAMHDQAIADSDTHTKLIQRYKNESVRWADSCSGIKMGAMSRLLKEPESCLEDLNLDPNNFTVKRYRTPTKNVYGHPLKQFPITVLKAKDDSWRRRLTKEALKDIPF
ncbi:hypothetical protein HOC32_04210 [Candidatus Woesearchaeota archaeon]|nr:hypothetical protein [Candidatus Woesearchaeota archaeon]